MSIQKEFPIDYLLSKASISRYQADSKSCLGYRRSLQIDSNTIDDGLMEQIHILADGITKAREARNKFENGHVNRDYLNYFLRVNEAKLLQLRALLEDNDGSLLAYKRAQ
jgi:hypothetical protein